MDKFTISAPQLLTATLKLIDESQTPVKVRQLLSDTAEVVGEELSSHLVAEGSPPSARLKAAQTIAAILLSPQGRQWLAGNEKLLEDNDVGQLVTDIFRLAREIRDLPKNELWNTSEGKVLLVPVQLKHLGSGNGSAFSRDAAEQIARAIKLYADKGVKRFVINMSWMLEPCADQIPVNFEEYQLEVCTNSQLKVELDGTKLSATVQTARTDLCSGSNQSQDAYKALQEDDEFLRVLLHFRLPEFDELTATLQSAPEPLYDLLTYCFDPVQSGMPCPTRFDLPKDIGEDIQVISIAASGNSLLGKARSYPLWPAGFPGVLSVSASDATAYSPNSGEVTMPGEVSELQLAGTSYAAARLSVLATKYLLGGGRVLCHGPSDEGKYIYPPLGYMPELDNSGGDHHVKRDVKNLSIEDAARMYCQGFPTE